MSNDTARGLYPSSKKAPNRLRSDVDREIAACDRAQQHVRPGSVADKTLAARQQALRATPVDDPAHAAVWRSVLGL